jgi:hypothetical protein
MPAVLTAAQANRDMGWTPDKVKAYWDARAKMCQEMADEGTCLAQVARHVPVTLGGLGGYTGLGQGAPSCPPLQLDAGAIATLTAGLISNPDATLRVQGPRIVTALDRHVVEPLIGEATRAATPYLLKYLGPPLVVLYGLSIASMVFSYQVLKESRAGRVKANRRRRRR